MSSISFFVAGVPKPAGSKRAFPVMTKDGRKFNLPDDCKKGKDWRADVQHVAKEHAPPELLTGPLRLTVTFYSLRPKYHFGRRKDVPYLKDSAPMYPAVKPDRTKLLRAIEDALTGIIWKDDAQVVAGPLTKLYGDRPGAQVAIEGLPRTVAEHRTSLRAQPC